MKTKNLVLSLIFPVICFLCGGILLFLSFLGEPSVLRVIFGSLCAAAGVFPLLSVIFGKTDISPIVKWQGLFTAAAAVVITAGFVICTLIPPYTPWAGIFVVLAIPIGFLTAAGITYGKIFSADDKRVSKWFTAFLSTPILYFLMIFMWLYIELSTVKLINIPG